MANTSEDQKGQDGRSHGELLEIATAAEAVVAEHDQILAGLSGGDLVHWALMDKLKAALTGDQERARRAEDVLRWLHDQEGR